MLVITGLMRSGTSACARMCHAMGFVMGQSAQMPRMGSDAFEWEDAALVEPLTQAAFRTGQEVEPKWVSEYARQRYQHYRETIDLYQPGFARGWGMKSPLVALHWSTFREGLEDAGEAPKLIVMRRQAFETDLSLQNIACTLRPPFDKEFLDDARPVQARINDALRNRLYDEADLVIDIETLRYQPERVAAQIMAVVVGR